MKYLTLLLLALILPIAVACGFTRGDFLLTASGAPDIDVRLNALVLPNATGVYDFGFEDLYSSRVEQFTIENRGLLTLRLRDIFFEQEETIDYMLDVSETDSLIPAGESTSFSVVFRPSKTDPGGVVLGIMSNDPDEEVYRFSLSGTGNDPGSLPPDILLKQGGKDIPPGSIFDFGSVREESESMVQFTLKNDPGAETDLTVFSVLPVSGDTTSFIVVAPGDDTLSPGESETFTVTFMPQSAGGYDADIRILSNDPVDGEYIFTVQGTATVDPAPDISLWKDAQEIADGGSYDFGNVQQFPPTPPEEKFVIQNSGTAVLNIAGITVTPTGSDGEFTLSGVPATVDPGSSVTFTVTFDPDADLGLRFADITIDSDDPEEGVYVFEVKGTSVAAAVPDIEVKKGAVIVTEGSLAYTFPDTPVGDSLSTSFTINNVGTAILNVNGIQAVTGASHYDVPDTFPLMILPGGSGTFAVAFHPQEKGNQNARIEIVSDDTDESPFTFMVKGKGVKELDEGVPLLTVGGLEYPPGAVFDFGEASKGVPLAVPFTVTNVGSKAIGLDPPLLTGPPGRFDSDMGDDVILGPGESFSFNIIFTPNKTGSQSANFHLRGEFSGTYNITLTGIGV